MAAPADFDVALVRAENPGPLTLTGTNTWIVGRDPAWIVDPGPDLEAHRAAVVTEARARGGAGGIALTHAHADHAEGAPALAAALAGVPVSAALGGAPADVVLSDGDALGPLRALATPGHAPDHLAFLASEDRVCFTGDAVLGAGSVFVAGQLTAYLAALERLRALGPALLCPGHGPPVTDPSATLGAYLAHRREREVQLLAALAAGARTQDELLDAAWPEVGAQLRGAAALSLRAHAEKLREEGRLPAGVRLG